jgi:outer membrane protein
MKRASCGGLAVLCLMAVASAIANPPREEPVVGVSLLQALASSLASNPSIQLQGYQVEINCGRYQQQRGRFDDTLSLSASQNRLNSPLTTPDILTYGLNNVAANLSSIGLNWSQELRNGISFGPVLNFGRTSDNLLNLQGVNRGQALYQMTVPLLRGRGRPVVAAAETTAGMEVDASRQDMRQVVNTVLGQTASNYWVFVGAEKLLRVAWDSEERGRLFADNVQRLIDADKSPKSDIHNVAANLADRRATRIAAEQNFTQSQQALALSMGLGSRDIVAISEPSDDFPEMETRFPAVDGGAVQHYLDQAAKSRGDLEAAANRVEQARMLVTAAKNPTRPQLDLTLQSGYSGLREGHGLDALLVSPMVGVRGVDFGVGIIYSRSRQNNAALGQLSQAEAALHQAEVQQKDLSRTVASTIFVALTGLRNAMLQIRSANESVDSFQLALEGEREKLRRGMGSLVEMLTVEDRLTTAMGSAVQAQLQYPLALTAFRVATGTLMGPDQLAGQRVERRAFVNLPADFLFETHE